VLNRFLWKPTLVLPHPHVVLHAFNLNHLRQLSQGHVAHLSHLSHLNVSQGLVAPLNVSQGPVTPLNVSQGLIAHLNIGEYFIICSPLYWILYTFPYEINTLFSFLFLLTIFLIMYISDSSSRSCKGAYYSSCCKVDIFASS
jgi:hypothetical protein